MEKFEFALTVVLVGVTIVFLALLALTLIFILYGKILGGVYANKNDKGSPPKATKTEQKNAPTPAPAPVVEQGIGDDVIAAISAAVACMMGGSSSGFAVRSIKRSAQPRKEWRMAGMLQNTRPF